MKRICNLITGYLFALFLLGFAIAFVLIPDNEVSAEENRRLAVFPEFTWERLADGSFSSDINDYFADQFPFRDMFVGIKGTIETGMLRGENNGVLVGTDGQTAVRRFNVYKSRIEHTKDMDYYYPETLALNVEGLNRFAAENGMETVTVLPPRSVDVTLSSFSYPDEITNSIHEALNDLSPETGYIDLYPLLRERNDAGEYVYFRTDHHWTARGAYYAYREILKAFGMENEVLSEEAFAFEAVPDFYGTTWSKAGCKFIEPDTLEIPFSGGEDDLETVCLSERMVKDENGKPKKALQAYETFDGWLDRSYLSGKDKYGALLDGTHFVQTVFSKSGERQRLLVVKDSFANMLVPYLSVHFDLVIVSLADGITDVTGIAGEYGATRALIVYNWENLITNTNPASLR
jgi:hypothetical protein